MGEGHYKGEKIYDFLAVIVTNTIMRIIGFFMRSVLIIIGVVSYILAAVFVVVVFVVWPLLPVVVGGSIIWGFHNLFA